MNKFVIRHVTIYIICNEVSIMAWNLDYPTPFRWGESESKKKESYVIVSYSNMYA